MFPKSLLQIVTFLSSLLVFNSVADGQAPTEGTLIIDQQALDSKITGISIATSGITDEVKNQIIGVVSDSIVLATNTKSVIQSGGLSPASAINVLSTFANAIEVVGLGIQNNAQFDDSVANSLVTNITTVFQTMLTSGFALTELQRDSLKIQLASLVSAMSTLAIPAASSLTLSTTDVGQNNSALLISDTSLNYTQLFISNLEDMLTVTRTLGLNSSSGLLPAVQSVSKAFLMSSYGAITAAVDPRLASGFTSDSAVTQQLEAYPQLLAAVVETIGVEISSTSNVDSASLTTSLTTAGINLTAASTLASNLAQFQNPEGILITNSNNQQQSANTLMAAALGASTSVSYQAGTLNTVIFDGATSTRSPRFTSSSRIVPAQVPAGFNELPDGTTLLVEAGLASLLVPAPADLFAFAAGVNAGGASLNFKPDGSFSLSSENFNFSASFAVDLRSAVELTFELPSFTFPVGDPASPSYAFAISYNNGVEQGISPHLHNPIILGAILQAGFSVETDRSNGVLTISGSESFRPDYFYSVPSTDDIAFRAQNGNPEVAFRATDANGDGHTDYKAITNDAVQVLYSVP